MAKRKASRRARPAPGATPRARGRAAARKARPAARKTGATKRPAARGARVKGGKGVKGAATIGKARGGVKSSRKATRAVPVVRPKAAKKPATPKPPAKLVPRKPVVASKNKPVVAPKKKAAARTAPPRKAATAPVVTPKRAPAPPLAPKAARPALSAADQARRKHTLDLDRARRRVEGDDVVSPTPPSSLSLDRTASAARSGRQELRERYDKHTETSPALTGGDVDADWESAYAVGDEAPGGDNPTPDQNVVDDIGLAVGVEYDDNEELEGAERIEERDRHRWEFDPASSDDFDER